MTPLARVPRARPARRCASRWARWLVALRRRAPCRPGGPVKSIIAVALIIGVPVMALRLYAAGPAFCPGRRARRRGSVFRPSFEAGVPALPVQLAWRLAYIAAPALVLGMALSDRDRERLRLGPIHLYGPAVVMALGAIVHLFARERTTAHEAEISQPLAIYSLCYTALIAVAMVLRLQHAPPTAARKEDGARSRRARSWRSRAGTPSPSRAYEREGQLERAADTAERAGDWARAARLNKVNGQDFRAGEMYSRAQMWKEALECYERSRSYAAAARVCLQIGDVERAAQILEQAGDRAGAVKILEEGGPHADLRAVHEGGDARPRGRGARGGRRLGARRRRLRAQAERPRPRRRTST